MYVYDATYTVRVRYALMIHTCSRVIEIHITVLYPTITPRGTAEEKQKVAGRNLVER